MIALLSVCGNRALAVESAAVTWTVIDVTHAPHSGDAHLIQFADGGVWMIDVGFARYAKRSVVPLLKDLNIVRLDGVVITHAHLNHYEGVGELLKAGINIGTLYFSQPDPETCNAEIWPGGCRMSHVEEFLRRVAAAKVTTVPLNAPRTLAKTKTSELQILSQSNSNDKGSPGFTINDSSAVLALSVGQKTVLFPGDVGPRAGRWLLKHKIAIQADVLVIPHHGLERTVSNAFFSAVSPSIAVATTSEEQWNSSRAQRIRRWFSDQNIPVYVSGRDGNVTVRLSPSQIVVE